MRITGHLISSLADACLLVRSSSVEPPPSEGNFSDQTAQLFQPRLSTALSAIRTQSPPPTHGIPINLIPPTPREGAGARNGLPIPDKDAQDQDSLQEKEGHDTSKGKKVHRILKERVHKGQAHIHTISRKIGRGGGRHVSRLKRSSSAPGRLPLALYYSQVSTLT